MALFFWDLEAELSFSPEEKVQSENSIDVPTSIIEIAQLSQFDETGVLSQRLESPELSYTDSINMVTMTNPTIYLQGKSEHWLATSNRGEFDQTNNHIRLIGDVRLSQNSTGDSSEPVKMSTEQINYYSESQIAETHMAVVIETDGHYIESQGMSLDIANSIFILTERVRSTHEPM